MNTTIGVLAVLALAGPYDAPKPAASQYAVIPHCLVAVDEELDLPAREAGAIVALNVKEGMTIQAGAVVAMIDQEQASIEKSAAEKERDAAKQQAESDIEIRLAEASRGVADAEYQQALEIDSERAGAISPTELRRLQLARHRAELQIEEAKLQRVFAKTNASVLQGAVDIADASLSRRKIVATIGGMVMNVYREAGEWTNAGDPVVKVVRMDRLRVEGFLVASEYSPAQVAGKPVEVRVQLERGRVESFRGVVSFVNPVVQAGNKYRVRAVVENRHDGGHWLLRPGAPASVVIDLR